VLSAVLFAPSSFGVITASHFVDLALPATDMKHRMSEVHKGAKGIISKCTACANSDYIFTARQADRMRMLVMHKLLVKLLGKFLIEFSGKSSENVSCNSRKKQRIDCCLFPCPCRARSWIRVVRS
jgi:hypothetical protein